MTIKQQGGIFGRNPTFNDVETDGDLSVSGELTFDGTINSNSSNPQINFPSDANVNFVLKPANLTSDQNYTTSLQMWTAARSSGANYLSYYKITADPASNFGSPHLKFKYYNNGVDYGDQMILYSNGNLELTDGNLIMGTSGNGIDFSATSGTGTSELFDDYEEGTWTPAFTYTSNGNAISITYTQQTGIYTKVGNLVTVAFEIKLSAFSKNTASGALLISGLPFTSSSDDKGTGALYVRNTTYFDDPVSQSRSGTSTLYMYRSRSANTGASFDLSATSEISGTITYRV